MLESFKQYFLGNGRLTKRWCEEFFGDPDNFMPDVAEARAVGPLEIFLAGEEA